MTIRKTIWLSGPNTIGISWLTTVCIRQAPQEQCSSENLISKSQNFKADPLGGDQQIGAKIAEGEIDFIIFFSDPLEPMPHDPDVKALLRMAVVWNIPIACNRASADFMISSPLMDGEYFRLVPDYDEYRARKIGRPE
jgi:methylglyoxal synthase